MDVYSQTDKQLIKQVGDKLKQWRIEKNLSQKELAERSGVSLFTVSNIEKGNGCSVQTLIQLMRALEKLDLLSEFFTPTPISPILYGKILEKQHTPQRVRKNSKTTNNKKSEW